MYKMSCFFDIL